MNHSKQHEWLIGNVEKMVYVIKMIYVNEMQILHAFLINVKHTPDKISDVCQLNNHEKLLTKSK